MAYFPDLTEYTYLEYFARPLTVNVGWLDTGRPFEAEWPSEDFLNCLWHRCKFRVAQTRGLHECPFCPQGIDSNYHERNEEAQLLGSFEIRVFGEKGTIYAAPSTIFHYVDIHGYKPPFEFVRAIYESPSPPCSEYFRRLREIDLECREASPLLDRPKRTSRNGEVVLLRLPTRQIHTGAR